MYQRFRCLWIIIAYAALPAAELHSRGLSVMPDTAALPPIHLHAPIMPVPQMPSPGLAPPHLSSPDMRVPQLSSPLMPTPQIRDPQLQTPQLPVLPGRPALSSIPHSPWQKMRIPRLEVPALTQPLDAPPRHNGPVYVPPLHITRLNTPALITPKLYVPPLRITPLTHQPLEHPALQNPYFRNPPLTSPSLNTIQQEEMKQDRQLMDQARVDNDVSPRLPLDNRSAEPTGNYQALWPRSSAPNSAADPTVAAARRDERQAGMTDRSQADQVRQSHDSLIGIYLSLPSDEGHTTLRGATANR